MKKRFLSLSGYGIGWSSKRRIAVLAGVLALLLVLAGAVALFTGRDTQPAPSSGNGSLPPASPASTFPAEPGTTGKTGSVPRPPRISDPLQFAQAAAEMLWTYDTRSTTHEQQLAGMQAWMTTDSQYGDWPSVSAQMPTPALWARMRDQQQNATATATRAHYPAAFKQALAEDPAAITKAYIYAVTVTGKQTIAWAKGGQGAEDRSTTLAVQCRPSHDCSLVAIAPRVAP
ncbi:hypothetical protein ACIO3O_08280 [Streptomyces sp. NPDC087440]|uniref:hypothetical protein n=1 Tax=Streptomyces sp. NPDC087440 TaxID=3365790 RepID=UPI00380BE470